MFSFLVRSPKEKIVNGSALSKRQNAWDQPSKLMWLSVSSKNLPNHTNPQIPKFSIIRWKYWRNHCVWLYDVQMCGRALTRRAAELISCKTCDMWPTWIASIQGWLVHASSLSCKGTWNFAHRGVKHNNFCRFNAMTYDALMLFHKLNFLLYILTTKCL